MAPTGSEASHLRSVVKECGDIYQKSSSADEANCADVFGESTPPGAEECKDGASPYKTDEAENILTNPELIKEVFHNDQF